MIIYMDLILFLNFVIDLIILMVVGIVLKRKKNLTRIILGAFVGSLSVLFLLIKLSNLELFIYKILLGFIMTYISFGYQNIKYVIKNFLYYLNILFSYRQEGIIFIFKGLSINIIILFLVSPIILFMYIKQMKEKTNYNIYHNVEIYFKNKIIKLTGFIDTGNKLVDPYMKKPIILIPKNKIDNITNKIIVPYMTIDNVSLLECISVDNILIDGISYKNKMLVGLIDKKINIDGIDCILNYKLMEELC